MLLVIDVGNTNFVLGLYKKEKFPLLSPILCILSRRGFANISISNR